MRRVPNLHVKICTYILNSGEVHVGGDGSFECAAFTCGAFKDQKCCYYPHWNIHPDIGLFPFPLNIFGDDPITTSLSVKWRTDSRLHYPTDLGVYLERKPDDPTAWVSWQVVILL